MTPGRAAAAAGSAAGADGVAEWVDLERSMILVRLAATVFALVMVATYDAVPYPPGVREAALGLVALLVAMNAPIWLALRRLSSARAARALGLVTLVLDASVVFGFFGIFAFDETSAHYLLFFLLPAEAALKFRLAGALSMWAACTLAYVGRGLAAEQVYGYELNLPSATFRMGMLLLVAIVMGTFARRLADRAAELRLALHGLESEERWRTALIDMLAHDLRSPIGTASSALELIAHRSDSLDDATRRQLAEAAARQNRRALNLADDLLDMARARQGRLVLNRERIDVRRAVLAAVEQLPADNAAEVSVDVADDVEADVDPGRLSQILVNLLSNARKHGRPPITVTADLDDGDLRVRVSDMGEGLSERQAQSLFEPMAANPRSDSVGLGLWIVMTLATAHGGDAVYETLDGRPTFTVRLPSVDAETSAPQISSPHRRRERH
jgi:signal transduction histidine kinase